MKQRECVYEKGDAKERVRKRNKQCKRQGVKKKDGRVEKEIDSERKRGQCVCKRDIVIKKSPVKAIE